MNQDETTPPLTPHSYSGPSGLSFAGELADGSGGARVPGVLVAPEAPGLRGPFGDNIRARARRLAARGYVALAADMYGRDLSLEEAMPAHADLTQTPGKMLAHARAALDALTAHPHVDTNRMAAIGFCQGGMSVLELARAQAPIRAAIGFHPGLTRPAGSPDGGPIAAKVLMMVGDDDPVVPEADRAAFAAEMRAREADWQLHVFGGVGHTFTDVRVDALGYPGFAYNAAADRRSWAMAIDLLAEVFAKE